MSEYQKAKMPDYGDGPEPCDDCAIKDKRIAELEAENDRLMEYDPRPVFTTDGPIKSEGGTDD